MHKLGKLTRDSFGIRDYSLEQSGSRLNQQLGRRMNRLIQVPVEATAQVADFVIGGFATLGAVSTLGMNNKLFHHSVTGLWEGGAIVARVFNNALRVLNPNAKLADDCLPLFNHVMKAFEPGLKSLRNSENVVARHLLSRLGLLVRGLIIIVTRLIDLVMGLLAAIPALLVGGKSDKLNVVVYNGLLAPQIIGDAVYTMLKVINPWAGN